MRCGKVLFLTGDPKRQQSCAGLSPPANVRSRPCGTAQLAIQAERSLPSLLHRDFLSPWAHQRGPRASRAYARADSASGRPVRRRRGSPPGWDRDDRALLSSGQCCPARWIASRGHRPRPPRLPGSRARGRLERESISAIARPSMRPQYVGRRARHPAGRGARAIIEPLCIPQGRSLESSRNRGEAHSAWPRTGPAAAPPRLGDKHVLHPMSRLTCRASPSIPATDDEDTPRDPLQLAHKRAPDPGLVRRPMAGG